MAPKRGGGGGASASASASAGAASASGRGRFFVCDPAERRPIEVAPPTAVGGEATEGKGSSGSPPQSPRASADGGSWQRVAARSAGAEPSAPAEDRRKRAEACEALLAREPATMAAALATAATGPQRDGVALWQERLDPKTLKPLPGSSPRTWTWREYHEAARACARSLLALGLEESESVAILGFNSPEWAIADLGAILAGGLACGVYTTNEPEAVRYIVGHARARVAVCDGAKQLKKFLDVLLKKDGRDGEETTTTLDAIVCYDSTGGEARAREAVADFSFALEEANGKRVPLPSVYTWDEFMQVGESADSAEVPGLDALLEQRLRALRPEACATLIYTSGTTGPPKGVMISHDNALWTCESGLAHHPELADEGIHCRMVSFLPLSHIAAQVTDIFSPVFYAAKTGLPSCTYFARPDALKGSLRDTMLLVRPTLFFGVPRVWTKFEEGMRKVGAKLPAPISWLSRWAKAVGARDFQARCDGGNPRRGCAWLIADRLVFSQTRKALGLDQCHALVSGAAPVPVDTLRYFGSIGMHVLEVYGMSENTGPALFGRNYMYKPGSVGTPIPATEVRIDHVPGRDPPGEGEVLLRGRHVMLGYLRDEAKTRQAIDEEGYLHTGDVGRVDAETGAYYITGRIKELLITEGGENVAPVPIEAAIREQLPALSQVVVVGDRRKYLTCLVTLQQQGSELEGFSDELVGESRRLVEEVSTGKDAVRNTSWGDYIAAGIRRYNTSDAVVSNAARVQKFALLPLDFSVPGGELTPTLKLVRPTILKKYSNIIDAMYEGARK